MTRVLVSYANQDEAKIGLSTHVTKNQQVSLGQALNQAFDGAGKNSGNHVIHGYEQKQHVLHASAGKIGADDSVTLFYFFDGDTFELIALGEHEKGGYRIDATLGQDEEPFKRKRVVDAEGW